MQRATGSCQRNQDYDRLLSEAVKLGRQHETKAKHFVPKMYEALVKGEGLEPLDAADRIYKDLVGIWQKDTIRRLLPPESKNPVARDMQALSRFPLETKAGSTLRESDHRQTAKEPEEDIIISEQDSVIVQLERENAKLRKAVEDLQSTKKALIERALRLERLLAEERQQHKQQLGREKRVVKTKGEEEEVISILLPPNLFMKTYALMRGSSRPLVLKVLAKEAVDIDKDLEFEA